jgi:hypothetical protein
MGALDTAFRDIASSLIGVFVSDLSTLTRTPAPVYDPALGEDLAAAPTTYSIKVAPPENYKSHEIDGTAVRRTDLKTYVAAKDLAVVPDSQTDTLTFNSVVYKIVSVKGHQSGDQIALWELQLRK